jgi:hypothetical protein
MIDALGGEASAMPEAPASDAIIEAPEQDSPEPIAETPKAEAPQKSSLTVREAVQKARATIEAPTGDRPRDEAGRFAPKAPEQPLDATQKPLDGQQKPEAPKPALPADAPSRFTPDAKAAWASTPDPVKAEVSRAFRELETGLQQYQQRFEPLKPYMQMAEQAGTTVHDALERYTALEVALRDNPDAAISEIFRYAGINPAQWAAHVTGQQPNQQAAAYEHTIGQLQNEILGLKQQFQTVNTHIQTQQEREVYTEIEQFKAQRPRFDELQPMMVQMLETGFAQSLPDAYEKAEKLNPPPPPMPTPQPQPQRRTQQIHGAPPAGSNPVSARPSNSISESIARARARVGY